MKKQYVIPALVLVAILAFPQTTHAFSLKEFFGSLFSTKTAQVVPPTLSTTGTVEGVSAKSVEPSVQEKAALPVVEPAKVGLDAVQIRALQQDLATLGYYRGDITGVYGDYTTSAVMRFQKEHSLETTGIADEATLSVIGKVGIIKPLKYQCSDGIDNDGDGKIDILDPGCHSDSNASNAASYVSIGTTEYEKVEVCGDACTVPVCTIAAFTSSANSVSVGSAVTLSWSISGCAHAALFSGTTYFGTVALSGTMNTGPISQTTAYTLYAGSYPSGCTSFLGYSSTTGQSCITGALSATRSITVENAVPACAITSFVVPSSTQWTSTNINTTVSWATSNCDHIVIQSYVGSAQQPTILYYPTANDIVSGSHTFSTAVFPTNTPSIADTSVDITIIATNSVLKNIVSQTKTVPLIDVPNPAANQCAISSLTASPAVVSPGQTTTLTWTSSPTCVVYITGWNPNSTTYTGFGYTYYYNGSYPESFPSSGSFTVAPFVSTSYYVSSQSGGAISVMVVASKAVDVRVQ